MEESWIDISNPTVLLYIKSKIITKCATWDFIKSNEGYGLKLSIINLVSIIWPVLSKDFAPSIILVRWLLNRSLLGCPHLVFDIVDVRDITALYVLAINNPTIASKRFLATSPLYTSVKEIALELKQRVSKLAKKALTRTLLDFLH